MHDPAAFPEAHVAAIRSGAMTGSDLADDLDGTLAGTVMSAEGRAFSDACYEAYTTAFGEVFGDEEPYAVPDDDAARRRIEPALDALYAAWTAAGRPPSAPAFEPPAPDPVAPSVPAAGAAGVAPARARLRPDQLEALIPSDICAPPPELISVPASSWDSSLLRRALKRMEVRPADCLVTNAMGGTGEETLVVVLFSVPGIDAERLLEEFRSVIYLPRGSWQRRAVAGRTVLWMTIPEFSTAFWANDGLVVQVSGRSDVVEAAIPRLP